MTKSYCDTDQDDLGLVVETAPSKGKVRFISWEDHGSIVLADLELSRDDVRRLRDQLDAWLRSGSV